MAEVYSKEWYEKLKALVNSRDDISARAPQGTWRICVEVMGDEKSPYVSREQAKYFFVLLEKGKCQRYEELPETMDGKGLDFRFTGPASVFEEVAAGQRDFIEAGLRGAIKIRGDMRIFMQNAELVKIMAELYSQQVDTEWSKGKPPYD
ncbi:MAG: SCP2 sterol-binding domain-containing protein [Candidatus Hydrogenedentota bacterium]|nr:MAG: SCP2 sterol-binding domain-containing protein [Candidatus Hydrogenedentota bacterium]